MKNGFRTAILLVAAVGMPVPVAAMSAREFMSDKDNSHRNKEFDKAFDKVILDIFAPLEKRTDKNGNPKSDDRMKRDAEKVVFVKDMRRNYNPERVADMIGEFSRKQPDAQLEDVIGLYLADAWTEHTAQSAGGKSK